MSPRVWDSLRCWHVEWDLDELLLKAVSRVRLVARIKECLTTAGETNQLSHNVGTIHFWILMHVVHTYVLIHCLSAVSSVHGMWRCATSAVLEVTFSVVSFSMMHGLTSPDSSFQSRPLTISLFRQMQLTRLCYGMFVWMTLSSGRH